ncbi:MAG: hypothetical protein LUH82_03575 [Clostridiales bacterium]|nr:hypothetical protein [Clostridiales bacterium]
MIYKIANNNFREKNIFAENLADKRSYFIPFSTGNEMLKTDYRCERSSSSKVKLLSGEWQFKYFANCADLPVELNTDEIQFDKIPVPSMWQFTGYEPPVYVNIRYEFDGPAPQIPAVCPAGVYLKKFHVANKCANSFLSFLGAAGALSVYINGCYVGYSEGSHNTAEFDVSKFINSGENELLVVLHKWSSGSYLECQDMFRNNGIFRDVLLYQYSDDFVFDFEAKTTYNQDGTYMLDVIPKFVISRQLTFTAEIYDGEKQLAQKSINICPNKTDIITFDVLDVNEWSAETPRLYNLYLTLSSAGEEIDVIRVKIGFRHIEISSGTFYFNNKKIKLLGVNHHDTNPKTGYVCSAGDMENDIKIMKEYNVNCVRTSHYPPDPLFLALCDEYGIYVVDEADIETHGMSALGNINALSNDPSWREHYLDRVMRMYERDKNHPSITMFSLGNESGGIKCQDYCYAALKKKTDIPIHYEAACRTKRHYYDVYSQMYTPSAICKKIAKGRGLPKKYYKKPFFLCEYAHAMGVGAGELQTYVDLFYKSDIMLGGCIWEFADHAVYHAGGKYKYTYGGDHGERKHDYNFCTDGLFTPDRKPHTGALQMKECYSPVTVHFAGGCNFELKNNLFFRQLDIRASYSVAENGAQVSAGSFNVCIKPQEKIIEKINIKKSGAPCHRVIIFKFFDGERQLSRREIVLENNYAFSEIKPDEAPCIKDSEKNTIISCAGNVKIIFNRKAGVIESYSYNGTELFNQTPLGFARGFLPDLFRAPLDNDMYMKLAWNRAFLSDFRLSANRIKKSVILKDSCAVLTAKHKLMTPRYSNAGTVITKYTVHSNGAIDIDYVYKHLRFLNVPRIGMQLEMPREFSNIKYYGLDCESLSDFKAHAAHDVCKLNVCEMRENYIKPQESSMRDSTYWAEITDEHGLGLRFESEKSFVFSANHFTPQQCEKARHAEDLHDYDTTNVHIDAFMMGAGSNSCGQPPVGAHRKLLVSRFYGGFRVRVVGGAGV